MADLSVRLLDDRDRPVWDRFVQRSGQGTFYHEWFWLDLLARQMPGQDPRAYGCFAGDRLVGGCTLGAERKLTLRIAGKPWATHYFGLLLDHDPGPCPDAVVRAIVGHLEERFDVIHLIHSPGFQRVDPYRELGFSLSQRHTLVFMADREQVMWERVSHHARNASRRAIRERVRIVTSTDVERFARLYWRTYERQGLAIRFGRGHFEAVCAGVLDAGRGRLWIALDAHDRACAAVLIGWDDQRAYGLLSASDDRYCRNGSGTLLWWEIFLSLARRFREIDMVGQGTPATPGIRRFKMQFNPAVVPMHEAVKLRSASVRWRWHVLQRIRSARQTR